MHVTNTCTYMFLLPIFMSTSTSRPLVHVTYFVRGLKTCMANTEICNSSTRMAGTGMQAKEQTVRNSAYRECCVRPRVYVKGHHGSYFNTESVLANTSFAT